MSGNTGFQLGGLCVGRGSSSPRVDYEEWHGGCADKFSTFIICSLDLQHHLLYLILAIDYWLCCK